MASNGKAPALVVIQLSGGNDTLNTMIPYSTPAPPILRDTSTKISTWIWASMLEYSFLAIQIRLPLNWS